ncbi:MAG: Gfo/Idh/MocA family protein [Pleomorphochaeta sp.]
MRSIKVAIIGAGWFGNFHLDNINKMNNVEVIALVSTNKERLAAISKKAPNAHTYQNYHQMLDKEKELDAVIVCIPPDSHDNIEIEVAKRKINLWMEKPLGISMDIINNNYKAIKESNIISAVGYQTRYNPLLDDLKKAISKNVIGSVNVKWFGIMPPTPWWRIKERSGGQLAEQVTHQIDIIRYLFGDVESVYSQARKGIINDIPNFDIEDTSISIFKFKSGLIASIECGCFNSEKFSQDEIVIEIYGKEFSAVYRWDESLTYKTKQEVKTYYFGNEFHYPALKTFFEAIKTGNHDKIKSPYSDGIKTFATTFAANKSMESGKIIFVDDLLK